MTLDPMRLPGELWGVTSFYNPAGYANKLEHLKLFSDRVRGQGLKLLVIELAFGGRPFEVPPEICDAVVTRRSDSVLWQKERLLNLGIAHLPPECDKVAWLDGDILFENDAWVEETSSRLDSFVVVQPYELACWLPQGVTAAPPEGFVQGNREGQCMSGIASRMQVVGDAPGRREIPRKYEEHGHPGFAWAARRTLLEEHGLYDRHILGNGDFVIAHAMYGDETVWKHNGLEARKVSPRLLEDIVAWSGRFFTSVDSRVSYTPGRVLHLWHGARADRGYDRALSVLSDCDFDPNEDLKLDEGSCWMWGTEKPELHRWAAENFAARREEGDAS